MTDETAPHYDRHQAGRSRDDGPVDERPGDDRPADGGPDRPAPRGAGSADLPEPAAKRPWIERIGLAAIAFVMGALLTLMAAVSWVGGEWILAAMSASGALLTIGVGLMTLVRG
jgi:hypothetical protein